MKKCVIGVVVLLVVIVVVLVFGINLLIDVKVVKGVNN